MCCCVVLLQMLEDVDLIHAYLVRLIGATSLGFLVQLVFSLQFDEDEDRKSSFRGLLLVRALV